MLKILKPALVLFLVCAVVTTLLALTYAQTKDIILERQETAQKEARTAVLDSANNFKSFDDESIIESEDIVSSIYIGLDESGEVIGAVITVLPKGYGGEINMTVGVNSDGSINEVVITEHEETPGLGAKAKEEPFIKQFSKLKSDEALKVTKAKKTNNSEIEAISGATITSKAVVKGINCARDVAMKVFAKEGV